MAEKCERCGKAVYFDKSPEYDVCGICDAHICGDCGRTDIDPFDQICKAHTEQEIKEAGGTAEKGQTHNDPAAKGPRYDNN